MYIRFIGVLLRFVMFIVIVICVLCLVSCIDGCVM